MMQIYPPSHGSTALRIPSPQPPCPLTLRKGLPLEKQGTCAPVGRTLTLRGRVKIELDLGYSALLPKVSIKIQYRDKQKVCLEKIPFYENQKWRKGTFHYQTL